MVGSNQRPRAARPPGVVPDLGGIRSVLVTPLTVVSDDVVAFSGVAQAAVPAVSMGVRVTFMPGLSRSISRILERVWRLGSWAL